MTTDTIDTTTESIYDQTEYGRDLQISSTGHKLIQELQDLPSGVFADADMKEVYVIAVTYGYYTDRIADEEATGSRGFVARKALSDDQVTVMEAAAVGHEETPMVLSDQELTATIAQRYALGGLEALLEQAKAADNPRAELISEMNAAR